MAIFHTPLSNVSFALLSLFVLVVSPISGLRHNRALDSDGDSNVEQAFNAHGRIVGGASVQDQEEHPSFVRLRIVGRANQLHCGGSLIGPDVVLSAAHCYQNPSNLIVGINAYYLNNENVPGSNEIERRVTRIVRHPKYNPTTFEYDFMLLFLDQEVPGVQPIQLNQEMEVPEAGSEVKSIGLGSTDANYYRPAERLQQISITTLSDDFCNSYQSYSGLVKHPIMFCAGFQQGTNRAPRDSCYGDSGGPLLKEDAYGFIQVGVVSWGVGCAEEYFPGVYANVAAVYDWIDNIGCHYSKSNSDGHLSCHRESLQIQALSYEPEQEQDQDSLVPSIHVVKNRSRSRRRQPQTSGGGSGETHQRLRSGARHNADSSD